MRLTMTIDRYAARRWQIDIADRLRGIGHTVAMDVGGVASSRPAGLAMLERFEQTLYGTYRPLGGMLGETDVHAVARGHDGIRSDLVLDLVTGDLAPGSSGMRLVLLAEGLAPDVGIASALLDRRAPWLDLVLIEPGAEPRLIVSGLPAVPDANVFIRGYESVAGRAMTLILLAVPMIARGVDAAPTWLLAPHRHASLARAGLFAASSIVEKIRLRLKRMSEKADQWTVGWREIADDAVIDTLRWPVGEYHWLPDDGLRYYADPFVFEHEGQRFLFVEEYVYATGRGHLSVANWTGSGWSTPRAMLERPYHLSWPRVFARNGEIWMLPETSEARTLELYRAVDFPYRWELAKVLASDILLADATVVERDGAFWMLASIVDRPGTSSWDGLAVLHADDPLAAWRLTGEGASLVDVRAARPAGDIMWRDGHLLRPVQDCSLSYGGALGIARIDTLDEGRIRQTLVAHLPPKPEWNAIGVHTLNIGAGLEVIDINRGFDIARRPPSLRP